MDPEELCPQIRAELAISSFNSLDWNGQTIQARCSPSDILQPPAGVGMPGGEGRSLQGDGASGRLMFCLRSFLYYAQVRPVFCFPAAAAIYSLLSVCHSACDLWSAQGLYLKQAVLCSSSISPLWLSFSSLPSETQWWGLPRCPSHPLVCQAGCLGSLNSAMHRYLQVVLWSELVLGGEFCSLRS